MVTNVKIPKRAQDRIVAGLTRIIRDVVRFGGPRFSVPACM